MIDPTKRSVRRVQVRITAAAVVAVAAVLLLTAVGMVRFVREEQLSRIDDQLESSIAFARRAQAAELRFSQDTPVSGLVQAVDNDGNVTFASANLEGAAPLTDFGPLAPGESRLATVDIEGVGSARIITARYDAETTLLLGSRLDSVSAATASLQRVLAFAFPLLALALGVLIWFVVGRALRPLRVSLARERRLVADASHELRSPLAGARALLETEPDDPEAVRQSRREVLTVLARLDRIADDLLVLEREDRDGRRPDGHPVDLDEFVRDQIARQRSLSDLTFETSGLSSGQVVGYESDLTRLVENLLANAARHAATTVWVSVQESDSAVALVVADDGPGIAATHRERIFERFTRLDDARTRDEGGAGLGLAIVSGVVRAHGGEITVDESPAGGARFTVRLPASVRMDSAR